MVKASTETSKRSFIMYNEHAEFFNELSNEDAGVLIKAVMEYECGNVDVHQKLSGAVKFAFIAIRQALDRNRAKHNEISEIRKEAGRKGGLKTQAKASFASSKKSKSSNCDDNDNENDNVNESDTTPPKSPKGDYTDDFLAFWSVYPKRVGKGDAFKAWKKAKAKPSVERMAEIIAEQKTWDSWNRDGGQYIPHPATWLNQRRWDDEGFSAPPQPDPKHYVPSMEELDIVNGRYE